MSFTERPMFFTSLWIQRRRSLDEPLHFSSKALTLFEPYTMAQRPESTAFCPLYTPAASAASPSQPAGGGGGGRGQRLLNCIQSEIVFVRTALFVSTDSVGIWSQMSKSSQSAPWKNLRYCLMRLARKGLPTSGSPISTTTCMSPWFPPSAAIGGGSSVGSGLCSDCTSKCSCDLAYPADMAAARWPCSRWLFGRWLFAQRALARASRRSGARF
mmetsp:Transcript_10778/g.28276  ORF Transcript_10778/g.28276 Transcript_10778/m.28276 type:complete len:214 (+) Transcript_10778:1147-1788(+)